MQTKRDGQILGLIPAYNESPRVGAVIRGALEHLPVLVVDDGSKDGTAEVAEAAGVAVLRQHPNQGKGMALHAGFAKALADGCEAVITLDADGQHDPAEIPAFLECYQKNRADLIIGRRDFNKMPPLRRVTNTIGTYMFSWAVGQHVPDNQSGYRLISRRLMEAMLASRERGFEFEVDMIVIAIAQQMKVDWVPISTIYRGAPSHIKPLKHLVNWFRIIAYARGVYTSSLRKNEVRR